MKKLIALIAVSASVLLPIQAQASDQKSLVIIDSYFDSRVFNENVTCVSVILVGPCNNDVVNIPASLSDNINHGNAMVEVAKRQSASLKIIALKATVTGPGQKSVSDVNPAYFLTALNWVDKNSSQVAAVSISRTLGGTNGVCAPSSTGGASDASIRDMISKLNAKGIKVFASTGNTKGTTIIYPACIAETNSVSSGSLNKFGAMLSNFAWDSNTDYFADYAVLNYKSSVLGSIAQTTSSATVAVAAQYVIGTTLTKVVSVTK
jgi:hypothetical protein